MLSSEWKTKGMTKAFCFAAILVVLAMREASATDPYDNVAFPQGSYVTIYPYYYNAPRLMDANGDTVGHPDAVRYQNSFKYTRFDTNMLPHTASFSALLPVGCSEYSGDRNCGLGDLSFTGSYWLAENAAANAWFGVRLQAVAPVGSYDKDRRANMGGNVWVYRPMLFAAKRTGDVHAELTAKYSIYATNNDTDTKRGDETGIEGYCGYYLRSDTLAGLHLNAAFGRDKTVNGATVPDSGTRLYQAGVSVSRKFEGGFSALLEVLSDFGVRNCTEGITVFARFGWRL